MYSKIKQVGDDLHLIGVQHLNLPNTLDCGQAFRWSGDVSCFRGIAHGRLLELVFEGESLVIKNLDADGFDAVWKNYFDFDRDYGKLREMLVCYGGEPMRKAVEFSPGLRLLRQDPWEMLVSFILSQNSNIPRIRNMISALSTAYGERLPCGGSAFPMPEALACLSPEDIASVRSGYRAPYIIDAARQVTDGIFDINKLLRAPTDEVYGALLGIHGVGPKVADCVLLFGFNRIERYPVDVWIKRAMADAYPQGFPKELTPYAGIAQQYLFHYYRTGL